MNFLAHFFFDRNHPDSLFAVGAATPDLLSIYNAGLRIKNSRIDRIDRSGFTEADERLLQGIERHFLADKLFHSSKFFAEETHFIARELEKKFQAPAAPRKYFIAHVLLELILDRVLIHDNPSLIGEYYSHYSHLVPFRTLRLSTEKISGNLLPNYENFITKFTRNRYLSQYIRWEHIIYVLRRILRRVGIENTEFVEEPKFIDLMDEYEIRLRGRYLMVFDEMNNVLSSMKS